MRFFRLLFTESVDYVAKNINVKSDVSQEKIVMLSEHKNDQQSERITSANEVKVDVDQR